MDENLSMIIYFNNRYVSAGGEQTPSGRCYGKILFSLLDEIFFSHEGSISMGPENVRPMTKRGNKNGKVFSKRS